MHEKIVEFMPIAKRCARNFWYKRKWLNKREMVAEAYFILTIIFLDGYSLQENQIVDINNEEFVNHVKSRIYRDLSVYIRPETRSKYTRIYQLKGTNFGNDETEIEMALAKVSPVVPIAETLETIVWNELDMLCVNCYLDGIVDDHLVAQQLGITVRKATEVRRNIINRLEDANLSAVS